MQVITYHVEIISRSKGRSAVQMAAYCAREKLYNAYNGRVYNTPQKDDLVHSKIMLPHHAPRDFFDRETLWNAVELIEKNINSRLARSLYFSLPKELHIDAHIGMTEDYVQDYFVNRGMCADVFIHDKGDGNPHVHTLLTTRSLGENGEWLSKQRRHYLLNQDGTRIRDSATRQYMLGRSIRTNNWDDHENIEIWRKGWADACNIELEREGLEKRVTHISYARQGLDIEPTKHNGRRVMELERRGIPTDRGNENRAIEARNKEREERKHRRRLQLEQDREFELSR